MRSRLSVVSMVAPFIGLPLSECITSWLLRMPSPRHAASTSATARRSLSRSGTAQSRILRLKTWRIVQRKVIRRRIGAGAR